METYCASCKIYTENENWNVRKTKQNRLTLLSNWAVCGKKKSTFIEIKNSTIFINLKCIQQLKSFYWLLESHLKEPRFTYSACGPFTKHHEKIQKFRETGHLRHLYRNELDKACFALDTAYSDSKDLVKRAISDKILRDRAYEIARNCKYDGYQTALASMVYNFFYKKRGSKISVNEELAEELREPVIRKFKRRKVYAKFKGNILETDLAEMGSLSSYNENIKYILCAIDVSTKHAWFKPIKNKKSKTFHNVLIELVNESNY